MLPLLVAVQVSSYAMALANGGVSYLHVWFSNGQAAVRAGLGVRWRVSGLFALQPEISYLRAFTGSDTSWLSGELSFVAGEVP